MELHLALKNIVNLSGTSILKEQRLVNILADFNAYDDIPSAKFIIKTIIDEGYMEKLLANGKWDLNCDKLIDQFAAMTGIVKDNVSYVFESLGFSLGWNTTSVTIPSHTQKSLSNTPTKSSNNGLQCVLECGNGNGKSNYMLSNPSTRKIDEYNIVVACDVAGSIPRGTDYFYVCCAIYEDDSIVKTEYLHCFLRGRFSGFGVASSEIKLDTNVNNISRIVFYLG